MEMMIDFPSGSRADAHFRRCWLQPASLCQPDIFVKALPRGYLTRTADST
jgi:hypothetical protein